MMRLKADSATDLLPMAHQGLQDFGNGDAAIGLLMHLDDRYEYPGTGHHGVVQRMTEDRLAVFITISKIQAAALEVVES